MAQCAIELFDKANRYRVSGEYEKAIIMYTMALKKDTCYGDAYYNSFYASIYLGRGVCYNDIGNYAKAVEDFTNAISIDPQEVYYNARADAKYELKDYRGAISDITESIKIDPSKGRSYYRRAEARTMIGQKERACMDYIRAGGAWFFGCIRRYCD
jgi:tetratricopeptide (TPR) repeat protein